VENTAIPPDKPPEPTVAPPLLKATTSPSGGGPELELTVAVNVTDWPTLLGFNDEVTAVVVDALPTTCVRTGEVFALKFESPA
jgi:hypothetical protein